MLVKGGTGMRFVVVYWDLSLVNFASGLILDLRPANERRRYFIAMAGVSLEQPCAHIFQGDFISIRALIQLS